MKKKKKKKERKKEENIKGNVAPLPLNKNITNDPNWLSLSQPEPRAKLRPLQLQSHLPSPTLSATTPPRQMPPLPTCPLLNSPP